MTTGSTSSDGCESGLSPIGMIEVGGTSLSETATIAARIVPVTNSGSAISPRDMPEMT